MGGLPGGCKTAQELAQYLKDRVVECLNLCKSKEETVIHLWEHFQITRELTTIAWDSLEQIDPDLFKSYYAACEIYRRIRERDATKAMPPPAQITEKHGYSSPPGEDAEMAKRAREQDQQRLLPRTPRSLMAPPAQINAFPSPPEQDPEMAKRSRVKWFAENRAREQQDQQRRLVETAPNVKRDAAATSQVPKEAANTNVRRSLKFVEKNSSKAGLSKALGKQKVQASQKPVPPSIELWKQILSTLGEIGSTREQMLKLMTDGQCFGSRPSAAGSSKRQRAEKEQERGDNEEAEKLQEQERGDNEEAEKLQEQERGDNEEAEKLQEQERGDNEEAANKKVQERGDKEEAEKLQEQERGDNEKAAKLQEKERGDNEEAANQKEKERGDTEEAEKLQEKVRGDKEEAANEKEQERGDNEEAAKLLDLNQPSPQ